jgi:transposase
MKYTQNEKILQITEEVLVIGTDIAKEVHAARGFDFRGIEYGKRIDFENSHQGYQNFLDWATGLKTRFGKKQIVVGLEPTGHYWFNYAQFLKDNGIRVLLVNPYHVKQSKELDDNSPTKNDRKDPKTIAMLVKDGRFVEPYIPEGIYRELRVALDVRERINKQLNIIRNRVARWLDIYFPEFGTVFSDWEGKAALMTLQDFPTPDRVIGLGAAKIAEHWKKEVKRTVGLKRAIKLETAAKKSIGQKQGLEMARYEMALFQEEYELYRKQLNEIEVRMGALVVQVPGISEILRIKGIGVIIAAGLVAEIGDISRFTHPKQIQKLAGLNLKENSSGKHKGKTGITRRGRRRLRAILFLAMMPLVANNKEFQSLHHYYTTRSQNPLKKKQSLVLLGSKLIRIYFALMTKHVAYDPQKMLSDIRRPQPKRAA